MSDNETQKTPPEQAVTEPKHEAAKVGVKDRGKVVYTADGERVDGIIADLADGD